MAIDMLVRDLWSKRQQQQRPTSLPGLVYLLESPCVLRFAHAGHQISVPISDDLVVATTGPQHHRSRNPAFNLGTRSDSFEFKISYGRWYTYCYSLELRLLENTNLICLRDNLRL
jgi:hypothetical protein